MDVCWSISFSDEFDSMEMASAMPSFCCFHIFVSALRIEVKLAYECVQLYIEAYI